MLLLLFGGGGAPAVPVDLRACLTVTDAATFTLTTTDAATFTLTVADTDACNA
ncbi:MAG: hypothetical protein WC565_07830 [Parcubacteria group bacterium]